MAVLVAGREYEVGLVVQNLCLPAVFFLAAVCKSVLPVFMFAAKFMSPVVEINSGVLHICFEDIFKTKVRLSKFSIQ